MPSNGSNSMAATMTLTSVFSITFSAFEALSQRSTRRLLANKCLVAQSRKSRSGSTSNKVSSCGESDIRLTPVVKQGDRGWHTKKFQMLRSKRCGSLVIHSPFSRDHRDENDLSFPYGFTGSGFFAKTEHQPAAVTSLPPKAVHGPFASPGLP